MHTEGQGFESPSLHQVEYIEKYIKGKKSKGTRAYGGCQGNRRRRRTWPAAKSHGELQASEDPWISEWGNPIMPEGRRTMGRETSQYHQEKKSNEIP